MQYHKAKKAFTIIELVIVIATIAVVSAISINYLLRAKEKKTMDNIANIISNMVKTNMLDDEVGYYAKNSDSFNDISKDELKTPIDITGILQGWSIQVKSYTESSATKYYYLIEKKQGEKDGIKCEFWYKKDGIKDDHLVINLVCGSGTSDNDIDYHYLLNGIALKLMNTKDFPEFSSYSSAHTSYKYICPSDNLKNSNEDCSNTNVFKETKNIKQYSLHYVK